MQAGRLPPNDHRPDAPSGAPDSTGAARAIVAILETRDLDSVDAAVAADYVDHQGLGEREIRGLDLLRFVDGRLAGHWGAELPKARARR